MTSLDYVNDSDKFSICFSVSSLTETQSFLALITQSSSKTVQAGSPVTFKCSAQSNKKITYEWQHNNNTIQTDKEPRITIRDDGSLRISKAELDDEGIYRCLASIKRGARKGRLTRKSRLALLTVEGRIFSLCLWTDFCLLNFTACRLISPVSVPPRLRWAAVFGFN